MALPTWHGCPAEPAAKTSQTNNNYTYLYNLAYTDSDGEVTRIQAYNRPGLTGGDIYFGVMTADGGNNFTDTADVGPLTIGNGLNDFSAPGDFTKFNIASGQYVGHFAPSGNAQLDRDTSGSDGYRYLSGDGLTDRDQDALPASGNIYDNQFRFYIESIGIVVLRRRREEC